jgi:hypothetical protein
MCLGQNRTFERWVRTSSSTSSLKISLKEKDVSLLDEVAKLSGRFDGLHFLKSFRDRAPEMSQTLRCFKVRQLDLTSVIANGTNVSVALLLECSTILGRVSNHMRTNDDFAASLLERFSLAGHFVILIFRFYAASW